MKIVYENDYSEQVSRGAALLDLHEPQWPWRINLDRLDMASQVDDVLGQLYGSYKRGFREVLREQPCVVLFRASDLGFTLPSGDADPNLPWARAKFAALTNLWRDEIEDRLNEQY